MALDPRIAMSGRPLDVMTSLNAGLAAGERLRTMGVRDALLEQQRQSQQLTIQQQQQQQALQGMQTFGSALQGAMNIPDLAQRAKVWSQQIPALVELGIPEHKLRSVDLSNEGLKATMQQMQPFMAQQEQDMTAGQKDFLFYQSVIEDPNSTEEQKRAARIAQGTEARAGRGQSIEIAPGVFANYDANTGTFSDPIARDDQGNERPLTKEEQKKFNETVEAGLVTAKGEAETAVQVDRANLLADVAIKQKRGEQLSTIEVNRMNEAVEQGMAAVDSLPDVERGLELLGTIRTGGMTATSKIVTDFFGTTSGDIGELNRILAQNVLDGLAAFTGALSDSERQFVERMQTSLSQGSEFNIAELNRMKNLLKRKISQGQEAANLMDDSFAIRIFENSMNKEPSGFGTGAVAPVAPTVFDTSADGDISIDADSYIDELFK